MKRKHKLLVHILVWLVIFIPFHLAPIIIAITQQEFFAKNMPDMPIEINTVITAMSISFMKFVITFYIAYFILYKLLIINKFNWRDSLIGGVIVILIVTFKLFLDLIPVNYNGKDSFLENVSKLKASGIILVFVFTILQVGMAWALRAILAYFDERKKRKELETTNLKNELNLLRSQVNPHFIFNTLNNIDTLIQKDPDKASQLLIKLSDEMRYMLYDANVENIDIASELKFLNNYISLQEIRLKHANPVLMETNIDNPDEKIPPMLFLPLVENAFKHGIFRHPVS